MLRKQRPHRWVAFAKGDISVVVSDSQTFISARFVSGVRSPRIEVPAGSLVPTGACRVAIGYSVAAFDSPAFKGTRQIGPTALRRARLCPGS